MANEAYRAVFLRVHPTGKMVLSLTTQSDGREVQYAQQIGDMLGAPALGGGQNKTLEDVALYTFGSGELPPGDEGFLDGQAVYAN